MKSPLVKISLIAAIFIIAIVAHGEIVDRIVAVVGDRVILASEVANQVQMYMLQTGDQNIDPNEMGKEMLDQMVSDELILNAAEDDTTITASPEEIQDALQERIAGLAARFPSEQAFIDQLAREGLSKRLLEKRFRPEIRDQILKQKIVGKKLSDVSVSRQEVEDFYNNNQDSLPDKPARVHLAHILIKFELSQSTEDSLKAAAERAREMASAGGDFYDIAVQLAGGETGTSAPVGGRIGFIKKTDVVPEFGRAAFSLQAGAISGPVRTDYGYHIIKSHAKYGDSVDVSQILIPAIPSAEDSATVKKLADSLYAALEDGADFKELAKEFSDDDDSRATGGDMGEMAYDQLRPEFVSAMEDANIGDIVGPITSQLGYHILRLIDRVEGSKLTLADDYDILRNFARQQKTADLVQDWVTELKKKNYVDIREFTLTK